MKPGILQMIRAPFLSSIIAPLITGTLLSIYINEGFYLVNFLLVIIIGIGLHAAVNVYNDIYDTIQGTDKVNVHRNEASGGSGILQDHPEMMSKMFTLARGSLVLALLGTIALTFFINRELWLHLWLLFALSAFFSKYYTAPPLKLAYRGLGEVSVWFAFGPMAILIASVSQNIGLHYYVNLLMPISGLSTLSILLAGQLIDLDADKAGGKHGIASRLGTKATSWIYLLVQLGIIANVIAMVIYFPGNTWPFLISLIPYLLILPVAANIIIRFHNKPDTIKKGAKLTVLLHIAFSVMLIAGLVIWII